MTIPMTYRVSTENASKSVLVNEPVTFETAKTQRKQNRSCRFIRSMKRERDEATQEAFTNDLHSVFKDLNELMSSRLPDVTVQVC